MKTEEKDTQYIVSDVSHKHQVGKMFYKIPVSLTEDKEEGSCYYLNFYFDHKGNCYCLYEINPDGCRPLFPGKGATMNKAVRKMNEQLKKAGLK